MVQDIVKITQILSKQNKLYFIIPSWDRLEIIHFWSLVSRSQDNAIYRLDVMQCLRHASKERYDSGICLLNVLRNDHHDTAINCWTSKPGWTMQRWLNKYVTALTVKPFIKCLFHRLSIFIDRRNHVCVNFRHRMSVYYFNENAVWMLRSVGNSPSSE
jgi:hypothetical protein